MYKTTKITMKRSLSVKNMLNHQSLVNMNGYMIWINFTISFNHYEYQYFTETKIGKIKIGLELHTSF